MTDSLSSKEWEELCDGCGKCCGFTRGKPETGVACPGLDCGTNRCTVYAKRFSTYMCASVTPENTLDLHDKGILPDSCAYVRHLKGEPPLEVTPVAKLIPFALAPRDFQRKYRRANKKWLKSSISRTLSSQQA